MMRPSALLLSAALAFTACNTPDAGPDTESAEPSPGTAAAAETDAPSGSAGTGQAVPPAPAASDDNRDGGSWDEGTLAALSNDGTYRVHYKPAGGPIERGQPFELKVWVLGPDGAPLRTDVALAVDAGMPEHEHGMNREPRVTHATQPGGPPTGAFEVEGMLFHMLGRWELYLDVTSGPVTERAQFEVLLE